MKSKGKQIFVWGGEGGVLLLMLTSWYEFIVHRNANFIPFTLFLIYSFFEFVHAYMYLS
jgi:hypothetical protein